MVSASELLRRSENAMPTCEKRRSTVAELAGQPSEGIAEPSLTSWELLSILLPPREWKV